MILNRYCYIGLAYFFLKEACPRHFGQVFPCFSRRKKMDSFCSEQVDKLAQALIKVQEHLQPATKDANNPFTKSRYATLNSVMDSCRDVLLSNGICLPVSRSSRSGMSSTRHQAHPCGVWTMAVEPCRGSSAQGRSAGRGDCRLRLHRL